MEQIATPMVFYRGGTSKALFVDARHLPVADERDVAAWILAIYGSPDLRQIDGLGGADPLTSKFAIVGPPTRPDADIDYTFYQVSVKDPMVSKDMNCGNISSAVGPYAIEQGFVKTNGDTTVVRVHATNFDDVVYVTVQTEDGKPKMSGDQHISGVPGTAAPVMVDFRGTVGTHGMGLLPTGNAKDVVAVDGDKSFEVSIVDIANLIVFAKAEDFDLSGTESPEELSGNKPLMDRFEKLRRTVGIKLGLAEDEADAKVKCSLSPFLGVIAKPQDWTEFETQTSHKASECDFLAFSTLDGVVHKAYMASGSSCTGVAAVIPGTIVNEICGKSQNADRVRIGHPSGLLEVEVAVKRQPGGFDVSRAALVRTARRLMDGQVYAARDRLPWLNADQNVGAMQVDKPGKQRFNNEIFHAN